MSNNANINGFAVVLSYVGEHGEASREVRAVAPTRAQAVRLSRKAPAYGATVSVERVSMEGRDFFDHVSPEA